MDCLACSQWICLWYSYCRRREAHMFHLVALRSNSSAHRKVSSYQLSCILALAISTVQPLPPSLSTFIPPPSPEEQHFNPSLEYRREIQHSLLKRKPAQPNCVPPSTLYRSPSSAYYAQNQESDSASPSLASYSAVHSTSSRLPPAKRWARKPSAKPLEEKSRARRTRRGVVVVSCSQLRGRRRCRRRLSTRWW